MKKNDYITNTFKETQRLGEDFAKTLKGGDVVCLYGELGAGKTTFVQGLAKGLGINSRIISPTFIIVRSYELEVLNFFHIDLYRMEGEKDLESLGIDEILNNKNNIVVIEWAENLNNQMPKKRTDVEFSYENDDVRKIVFRSSNQ
jgi:tRNA threonylcarbamoyladenosine biosynthesis protein TsaE